MKRILLLVAMLTLFLSATALANTPPSVHQHKWEYVLSSVNTMYYVDVNEENILYPANNMAVFYTKSYDKDNKIMVINKWAMKMDNKKLFARTEWGRMTNYYTNKTDERTAIGAWREYSVKSILFKCTLYLGKHIKYNK